MPPEFGPSDYFSDSPPPRIIGTENECVVQIPRNEEGYEIASPNQYIGQMAIHEAGFVSVSSFLDNGMRLYTDYNGQLEVCGGESRGPAEATLEELAAIEVLKKVVEASGIPHLGLYRTSGTSISGETVSSGYHQNFQFPREIESSPLFDEVLVNHLASRIWAGSGFVSGGFEFSQKARGIGGNPITREINRRTTHGSKPMVMIPPKSSEELTMGRANGWARAEIRFADPGLSPTTTYLSLATTSLVIRLIEQQKKIDLERLRAYAFSDPLEAAIRFNEDLSLKATAKTRNGAYITAIDYQELLADAALELSEEIKLPTDEVLAINLWFNILDRLRSANFSEGEDAGLTKFLNFVPKYRFLRKRLNGKHISSHNPRAVEASLRWDRILPLGGAAIYWANVSSLPFIDVEKVDDFVHRAPDTRARVRGRLVAGSAGRPNSIDWSKVGFPHKNPIRLNDPYNSSLKN